MGFCGSVLSIILAFYFIQVNYFLHIDVDILIHLFRLLFASAIIIVTVHG